MVETVDRNTTRLLGLILKLHIGIYGFDILVQIQVVQSILFKLLLRHPFFVYTKAQIVEEEDEEQTLYLTHPTTDKSITIPTKAQNPRSTIFISVVNNTHWTKRFGHPQCMYTVKAYKTGKVQLAFNRNSIDLAVQIGQHLSDFNDFIIPNPVIQYQIFYISRIFNNKSLLLQKYITESGHHLS